MLCKTQTVNKKKKVAREIIKCDMYYPKSFQDFFPMHQNKIYSKP